MEEYKNPKVCQKCAKKSRKCAEKVSQIYRKSAAEFAPNRTLGFHQARR